MRERSRLDLSRGAAACAAFDSVAAKPAAAASAPTHAVCQLRGESRLMRRGHASAALSQVLQAGGGWQHVRLLQEDGTALRAVQGAPLGCGRVRKLRSRGCRRLGVPRLASAFATSATRFTTASSAATRAAALAAASAPRRRNRVGADDFGSWRDGWSGAADGRTDDAPPSGPQEGPRVERTR